MATIFHQLIINADPKVIYEAITSQKGLSSWWIKDCEAKAEVGYINTFTFEGYPSTKMKIRKLVTDTKIVWKCVEGDKEWRGTKLTFSISSENSGSILQFKHAKWKRQSSFYATCNFHWARHFIMLKEYCESGVSKLEKQKEKIEIKKVKAIKNKPSTPKSEKLKVKKTSIKVTKK